MKTAIKVWAWATLFSGCLAGCNSGHSASENTSVAISADTTHGIDSTARPTLREPHDPMTATGDADAALEGASKPPRQQAQPPVQKQP